MKLWKMPRNHRIWQIKPCRARVQIFLIEKIENSLSRFFQDFQNFFSIFQQIQSLSICIKNSQKKFQIIRIFFLQSWAWKCEKYSFQKLAFFIYFTFSNSYTFWIVARHLVTCSWAQDLQFYHWLNSIWWVRTKDTTVWILVLFNNDFTTRAPSTVLIDF